MERQSVTQRHSDTVRHIHLYTTLHYSREALLHSIHEHGGTLEVPVGRGVPERQVHHLLGVVLGRLQVVHDGADRIVSALGLDTHRDGGGKRGHGGGWWG